MGPSERAPVSGPRRAIIELALAVAAAIGCVVSWLQSRSTMTVAPIANGEPTTTSVEYYAPLLMLALGLATAAGVLAVLGVARLRRARALTPAKTTTRSLSAQGGEVGPRG